MNSFKLELRVYDSNTRRWQVFLEKLDEDYSVLNWIPPSEGKEYFSKTWTQYRVDDDSLEVFIACTGYGGTARCVVLIDDAEPSKKNTIYARFDDSSVNNKSFKVQGARA